MASVTLSRPHLFFALPPLMPFWVLCLVCLLDLGLVGHGGWTGSDMDVCFATDWL